MYETILVPTDGSEWGTAAAKHAFALARLEGGAVHALSVVETRDFEQAVFPADVRTQARSAIEQSAADAVDRIAQLGEEAGCPVETTVLEGVPHDAILDYADDVDADVVVMGTHGRSGLERFLLGSVTERVLRSTDRPVLTTHPTEDETPEYANILVTTDGSDGAGVAIEQAVSLASETGATLHALSVVDARSFATSGELDGSMVAAIQRELDAVADEAVGEVESAAAAADVPVLSDVDVGLPADEIRQYVEEHDIDLVVMGTHGRSGVDRVLFGSVTEAVIRGVDVPVLAVHVGAPK